MTDLGQQAAQTPMTKMRRRDGSSDQDQLFHDLPLDIWKSRQQFFYGRL